ncbi:MAG: cell division protein FtsA [Bacilli bacterium]|nr:cell division protein FtsA [Bacilli bacterium]MCI6932049.1 cell division protein FtsA [Mycoplasmatota bacterium]
MRKIFTALDIGSNTIKVVVGEFIGTKLNILSAVKVTSRGYVNNYILDKEALISRIKEAISKTEEELNIKIRKVILNVPTYNLDFKLTDGRVELEENVVKSNDIVRLLQDVSKNKIDHKNEIICTLPIMFKVDDEETINPYGKHGNILYVKSILVSTDKKAIYDLATIVNSCNLDIIDITTTGLVDYYNFKSKELDTKNIAIVNLGSTTTNISIFSKGIFINNKIIDDGGFYIDKEIASVYNLKRNETEYLKEKLALAVINNADEKETITLTNKNGEEITVNQYELSKIVSEKMDNLLKIIKKNINLLTKKEISYIIITGGLSEIKDINLLINNVFNKNGKIGKINNLGARDNSYSVALGMLKYFNSKLLLRNREFSSLTEEEIDAMCTISEKNTSKNSLISRVVGYFFDD